MYVAQDPVEPSARDFIDEELGWKKMAEFRSEFLHQLMGENDNYSEEQFWTKLREYLEEGGR